MQKQKLLLIDYYYCQPSPIIRIHAHLLFPFIIIVKGVFKGADEFLEVRKKERNIISSHFKTNGGGGERKKNNEIKVVFC